MANTAKRRVGIVSEHFHGNARLVVQHYREHLEGLRIALKGEFEIVTSTRKKKGATREGITAVSLNAALRKSLHAAYGKGISVETFVEDGVFHSDEGVQGFDFSIYDKKNNLIALRNLCFGRLRLADGHARWGKFLRRHPDLSIVADAENLGAVPDGKDIVRADPESPIILGEFQFGNWGLLYRDFFKALNVQQNPGLDLFVYVAPTGKLRKSLSDAIVCYETAVAEAQVFSQVLRMPIWFIGIDFV